MIETTMKKINEAIAEARMNDPKIGVVDHAPVDLTGDLDVFFDEDGYFDENKFQWGAQ